MRLIDADAIPWDCLSIGGAITSLSVVNKLPTIDAVPLDRLGDFGKLFMDYTGCPRGAMGRACMPIEEEVLQMKPITDVDGGRWIPVNADALHELVKKYASLRAGAQPVVHASLRETGFDEAYCNWGDCTRCGCSNIFPSKYCNECGARLDGDPHDSGQ